MCWRLLNGSSPGVKPTGRRPEDHRSSAPTGPGRSIGKVPRWTILTGPSIKTTLTGFCLTPLCSLDLSADAAGTSRLLVTGCIWKMVKETDSYRAPLDIVVSMGSTVNIAQWCITPIGHLDSFAGAHHSYRTSLDEKLSKWMFRSMLSSATPSHSIVLTQAERARRGLVAPKTKCRLQPSRQRRPPLKIPLTSPNFKFSRGPPSRPLRRSCRAA